MAAKEASFDVVSEVDLQEVRNAVDQAQREIGQRFDFKGTGSEITLGEEGGTSTIQVKSNTEQKVKDVVKVLEEKLVKRKVALKALQAGKIEPAAGGTARQTLTLNQGIDTDKGREIVKFIKDKKLKAQVAIQGDQVRVSSKSRDTLQEVIEMLREHDFGIPLQFTNYR
ncbi:MAG: YajQ family cyclic di-GMP-binding protein [Actinomycetota bacterium]|nr:YajQ family cyclic di-GMP-binding protein [Actinomycetota bacterium]